MDGAGFTGYLIGKSSAAGNVFVWLIAWIRLDTLIPGLKTSSVAMRDWGPWLNAADQAILTVFVVEISRLRNEVAALRKHLGAPRRAVPKAYGKR